MPPGKFRSVNKYTGKRRKHRKTVSNENSAEVLRVNESVRDVLTAVRADRQQPPPASGDVFAITPAEPHASVSATDKKLGNFQWQDDQTAGNVHGYR